MSAKNSCRHHPRTGFGKHELVVIRRQRLCHFQIVGERAATLFRDRYKQAQPQLDGSIIPPVRHTLPDYKVYSCGLLNTIRLCLSRGLTMVSIRLQSGNTSNHSSSSMVPGVE